jgi:(2R)-3-sulfolactate dehydrogenase (NADP+)
LEHIFIKTQEAMQSVCDAFESHGITKHNAEIVAHHLVLAETDGQLGHGLSRVRSYLAQIKSGKVNISSSISSQFQGKGWLALDADHGFAFPALDHAYSQAMPLIRENGALLVTINKSHHAGVLGHHVERYAEQGVVALMFSNTPAAMAPWGGSTPIFGTNPIAFSCPRGNGSPLVIDLSLTKIARGKVMRAKTEGKRIPADLAVGADGIATTDPEQALNGAMLPMGGAKGAALALMVELITAGLAGAHYGFQASSFLDTKSSEPNVAQTLILIAPPAERIAHFETLFSAILTQPDTRLPGINRLKKRADVAKNGLRILKDDYTYILSQVK